MKENVYVTISILKNEQEFSFKNSQMSTFLYFTKILNPLSARRALLVARNLQGKVLKVRATL